MQLHHPPSVASLRGLDGVNLFLAGALSGFGPYVAVYLAEQKWTRGESCSSWRLSSESLTSRIPRANTSEHNADDACNSQHENHRKDG
jgi:hypothetical protein